MRRSVRQESWTRPACLLVSAALAAGGLGACGDSGGEPVARLTVEPARLELPYGTYADLGFRWTPLADLEGRPRVFVHLLDSEGKLVRTFDHVPNGTWRTGQELAYEGRLYQSLLAPPLPPGTYALTAGLYHPEDGERWALDTAGEEAGRNEYRVATVEVPAGAGGGPGVPAVHFTPSWSPTLAGGDRQVIAYRWLTDEGSIRMDDLGSAGTVWLSLGVPTREVGTMRRRIVRPPGGGDEVPRVKVTASCSGFEAQVSGEGTHGVEVPVEPAAEGCEIGIAPNFLMESPTGERRSLILEVLAWRGSGS